MRRYLHLGSVAVVACGLLSGCSTLMNAGGSVPVETRPGEGAPPASMGRPRTPPASLVPVLPPPVVPLAPPPATSLYSGSLQGRRLAQELLPSNVHRERSVWATDIAAAVGALGLPPNAENYCAAMAVIEQESSFQADPEVAGLSAIVWREIETRRQRYHIPKLALDAALTKTSPDGRSYRQRINSLRTERQMSLLYSDIIDGVPGGKRLLSGYNPVHTGGPMQVSVAFAREHARDNPYAIALVREAGGDVRNAVFSRKGGLYFGIAHLLDYPAAYRDAIYRFADFNAGRYSSRNAAFQQALVQLTGQAMDLDGDLLSYSNGAPDGGASATFQAARRLAGRVKLKNGEILASLQLEKSEAFGRTVLYQRVMALADEAAGRRVTRELLPRINLKSPKIRSKITTAWFAERVNGRYHQCLKRALELPASSPL